MEFELKIDEMLFGYTVIRDGWTPGEISYS